MNSFTVRNKHTGELKRAIVTKQTMYADDAYSRTYVPREYEVEGRPMPASLFHLNYETVNE